MADKYPPLPSGFVLDGAGSTDNATPALPPGFQIMGQDDVQPKLKAPIQQPEAESLEQSGAILPISRDAQGNVSFDSNAGLLGAVKRSVMLPGEVMAGNVDPLSEEGIGRAAEFAGVFTPGTPAAGTGRGIAQLAARKRQPGMEAASAASRLGVSLPRAIASDKVAVQQAGKTLTNIPIGGVPLSKASRTAIDQLDNAANRVQEGFGSGNVANAGAVAREGMTSQAKALGGRVSNAYNAVDELVTQNVTTPLSETAKIATDIISKRKNAGLGDSGAVASVRDALRRPDGLNYQGIKDLRTAVGEMLDTPDLTSRGISQAELRRVYGALTSDLKNSVSRAGGEKASKAFETANQLAAKTSREREALNKVLGRDISDERLFDRISSMASSTARADRAGLARIRSALSKETWDEVASGVISKIGRDPEGNFSPDLFVTGWGKLSNEGKNVLFGGNKELSSALDDIATVSSRFKQMNKYANPSGTAQAGATFGYLSGMFVDPTTVVGSVVGAGIMSSVLAKPVSARALAAYAKAYEQQIAAPSEKSAQRLLNTARAVSALIANESGDRGLSAQIFPQLAGVRKVPAEQGNENQGREEGQNGGVNDQPRYLAPNEI